MRKTGVFMIVSAAFAMMCVCTIGCKDSKPSQNIVMADTLINDTMRVDEEEMIAETPMPKAADELFDDFIFNFAANRKLQMSRIAFPLPVFKDGREDSHIVRADWQMENFFMRDGFYTLIFNNERQKQLLKDTTVSKAVIEHVRFAQAMVKQYVFHRTDGQWMLTAIVYQPLSQSVNASFLAFYDRFSRDKAFQVESMASEVSFTCPDPDDDFGQMTGTFIPEQWLAFMPDNLPLGYVWNIVYSEDYAHSNQRIFMLRGIANGFETEMTFRKYGAKWKLVRLMT